jgi:hypothetical protein
MSTDTRRPTKPAAPDTGWMEYGLCRQTDPNLFFPEGHGAAITIQTEQAKSVCNRCPVRLRCLDWALDTGQYVGVWGGLSEGERRGLTRSRETAFVRCLEAQEFIEERRAAGAGMRELAQAMSVSYELMRRVLRYFEAERAQAAAESATEDAGVAA